MSKLLGLAYSDIHKHNFKTHIENDYDRFYICLKIEEIIANRARSLGHPPIFFCGDMFHDPEHIDNLVLEKSMLHFDKIFNGLSYYAISGNHDMSQRNTRTNTSPTYLSNFDIAFDNFNLLDNLEPLKIRNATIFGIPYLHDKEYWLEVMAKINKEAYNHKNSILLIHKTLPNCPTPLGFVEKDFPGFPKKVDKLWSNFSTVLSGHIHKPHKISDKALMLGATHHQNRGDANCEMGYWEIYTDKKVFKPLNHLVPVFTTLDKAKPGDYIITTSQQDVEEEEELSGEFSGVQEVGKLVKKYLKKKGIYSKHKKQILQSLINQVIDA